MDLRRRKRRKVSGKMAVLYISMIISLGAMGVGYAAWNDGLKVNMNITTGNIDAWHVIEEEVFRVDDGELIFTLSEDKRTLIIDGEVYPTFNMNIPIEIKDKGTVPSKIINIARNESDEISELQSKKESRVRTMSFFKDDILGSFDLNIQPPEKEEKSSRQSSFSTMSIEDSGLEGQISRVKREINDLEQEIDDYNQTEKYEFKYDLLFEQAY